jgi:hypothetical protein
LLDNVRHEETYVEIRSAAQHPLQMALAVRLREEAAAGWQNNLSIIAQSLTGIQPRPGRNGRPGWTLVHPQAPERFEFARAGDWTVFGFAQGENKLMNELIGRVESHPDPFGARATNLWLRVDVDLAWLSRVTGVATNYPGELPRVSATVTGDGGHVLSHATLTFPTPFESEIGPWTPPGSLLHDPLSSFTAVRGIGPLLSHMGFWKSLPLGNAPDQLYAWTRTNSAFHAYCAAPLPDAAGSVDRLSMHLLNQANPWLSQHGYIAFEPLAGMRGVRWGDLAEIKPFITTTAGETSFLLTGLFPDNTAEGSRTALATFEALSGQTNLVAYAWEKTSARLDPWLPVSQTVRMLARRAPMPLTAATMAWLGAVEPRLGETTTVVTRSGPNAIEFERKSTVGFTAAELHLMADWLESPQFPRGLHTTLAPAPQGN